MASQVILLAVLSFLIKALLQSKKTGAQQRAELSELAER